MAISLAEKLAAKKAAATSQAPASAQPSAPAPEALKPAVIQPSVPAAQEASSEAAQGYADILERLKYLRDLSGEPLEKEMTELKKALMYNPAACSLMLPQDIGQLVAALRRITGVAAAAAVKPAKAKGSSKPAVLTKEQEKAIWDEL